MGRYSKNRNWYEQPLSVNEAEAIYIKFCRAFRQSGWRDRVLTRLEWSKVDLVDVSALKVSHVIGSACLYLVAENPPQVWRATGPEIVEFLMSNAALHSDYYITDLDMTWCICKTHDEQIWRHDPNDRLTAT